MERLSRLRRWYLPAAGLTLAVLGLGVLALGDLSARAPGGPAWAPPRHAPPAAAPAQATGAPELTPPRPRRVEPAAPASGTAAEAATPRLPLPESRAALRAAGVVVELARAPELGERIRVLDGLLARLPEYRAVEVLEGLLDSELPGTFREAEELRLVVLSRLGALPGPRSGQALAARLEPVRPRPQRLIAIELLASRDDGRLALEAVARGDHDSVVQDKARWALARSR